MKHLGKIGENKNINIYYINMSRYKPPFRLIGFLQNNKISKSSQKKIVDNYGINIPKYTRKKKRDKLVMDYAKSIRPSGRGFRNVDYAYRFLARLYNTQAEHLNELAREEFVEQQEIKNELVSAIRDFRINNLESVPFLITRERLMKLGKGLLVDTIRNNIAFGVDENKIDNK